MDDDFDSFFADHYPRVVRSLVLALGEGHEAEDGAQEAFSRVLLRWRSVSAMDRPATWVYVVAVRHLRRQLRSRRSWRQELRSSDDLASQVVDATWMVEALALSPPGQRLAVVLRSTPIRTSRRSPARCAVRRGP